MPKKPDDRPPEVWPASNSHDVIYEEEQVEFLKEVERFQTITGRRYLDCSDVLWIARKLGYRKVAEPTALPICVKGNHTHGSGVRRTRKDRKEWFDE